MIKDKSAATSLLPKNNADFMQQLFLHTSCDAEKEEARVRRLRLLSQQPYAT